MLDADVDQPLSPGFPDPGAVVDAAREPKHEPRHRESLEHLDQSEDRINSIDQSEDSIYLVFEVLGHQVVVEGGVVAQLHKTDWTLFPFHFWFGFSFPEIFFSGSIKITVRIIFL